MTDQSCDLTLLHGGLADTDTDGVDLTPILGEIARQWHRIHPRALTAEQALDLLGALLDITDPDRDGGGSTPPDSFPEARPPRDPYLGVPVFLCAADFSAVHKKPDPRGESGKEGPASGKWPGGGGQVSEPRDDDEIIAFYEVTLGDDPGDLGDDEPTVQPLCRHCVTDLPDGDDGLCAFCRAMGAT